MLRPNQNQTNFFSILYDRIPKDHLLKRIANAVDFSFINELVADSYCASFGRPAKEPELMAKLCILERLVSPPKLSCPIFRAFQKLTVRFEGFLKTVMFEQWGLYKTTTVRNHGYILISSPVSRTEALKHNSFRAFFVSVSMRFFA